MSDSRAVPSGHTLRTRPASLLVGLSDQALMTWIARTIGAVRLRSNPVVRWVVVLALVLVGPGAGAADVPVGGVPGAVPGGSSAALPAALPAERTLAVPAELTRAVLSDVPVQQRGSTNITIGARSTWTSFVPEWSWPLQPEPTVLRAFEKPPQKWKPGHRGVDLSTGGRASPITSPSAGIVSFAGTVVDRGVLSIDHGGGRVSSFEPVTTKLLKGQAVGRGELVATAANPGIDGSPGHCGVPCLHWGVRVDGEYVDPLSFVSDRRPSVLLPLGD